MAVHIEEKNGIVCRYLNARNGMKIYLLPNVPMDAGEIPLGPILKISDIEEYIEELKFTPEQKERARNIAGEYRGKQVCALSVLGYAKEQGKFEEFAKIMEDKKKDFETIHPDLMEARTDVTTFFLGLYADLGKAPVKEAQAMRELVEKYGPGVVILPKK